MGKIRFLPILAAVGWMSVVACGDDAGDAGGGGTADAGGSDAGGNATPDSGRAPDSGGTPDSGAPDAAPATYSIGVTVTGLQGAGLILQNNGADDLPVTADGTFAFSTKHTSGTAYAVTVKTQPGTPEQTCVVSGGTGTFGAGNVTSVTVNCSTDTFTVGGTATGIAGTGLVLQNNAGDNVTVNADGTFAFATPIASGAAYAVTVMTQPGGPSQTCTVSSGSGTVTDANVTSVTVACVTNTYTVGGTVSNLVGTVVLTNNAGDDKSISANGAFTFATPVTSGATYAVAVKTQPAGMTCAVTNESGTVTNAAITNVSVTCTAPASCLAIKLATPAATNGNYVIDPDGAGAKAALTVYCDMTTDGGGYAYYKMTGGTSTNKRTDPNSCQDLGLEIAVPRTAGHLSAMFAWAGSDMGYFATVPGIYGTKSNVNYSNCPLNSSSTCASVKSDWAAIDGANWFASSRTNITEPNGDYVPDCWLGNGGTIDASGYTWLNDGNCGYATGANYICSDNAKKSLTKWSEGTNAWPDQACNPTNSFGYCNTNDSAHANAWATAVCQQNGYVSGIWTGNKAGGCNGEISMWCNGQIPCQKTFETSCAPGDQTKVELTCF